MGTRIAICLFALLAVVGHLAAAGDSVPAVIADRGLVTVAPYLQVVAPDAIAVRWQTRDRAFGWLEFGERGAAGRAVYANEDGLRRANLFEHRVVLTGLKPATTYWYRTVSKPIVSFAPYKVVYGEEERLAPVEFRLPPDARQPVTALVFNDLHNDVTTFAGLRRAAGETGWDFSIFNGDCIADPGTVAMAQEPLRAFTEGVVAGARPAIFLRGNHETRGAFARELPRWFDWPGGRPYFAFSAGPVRWVFLDCGEDKPDDTAVYAGLVDFEAFRKEQTEWLKREVRSPEFRRAAWRILVHHIPIHPSQPKGGFSQPCRDLWSPVLAKARIDLAISGHTHQRAFHPAGTIGNPYPVVIGGGPKLKDATVMRLTADPRRLSLRVLDPAGQDVFPPFERRR
jgi:hypothetical protein